jgi:hypothetical protein
VRLPRLMKTTTMPNRDKAGLRCPGRSRVKVAAVAVEVRGQAPALDDTHRIAQETPVIFFNEQDFFNLHNNTCEACNEGGELLCCSTCTLAYHIPCVSPKLNEEPPDDWICAICLKNKLAAASTDDEDEDTKHKDEDEEKQHDEGDDDDDEEDDNKGDKKVRGVTVDRSRFVSWQ